ncbi:MAG: thiol-disulfide interchange protein DsbA [Pseudomonadota bacterium]|jgi:thiol:disulfide interchange protein DsbA
MEFIVNKTKTLAGILCIIFSELATASPQKPEANFDYHVISDKTTSAVTGVKQPNSKVEVVEFFSYGCGHCYAFDPYLKSWVEKNKQNVILKRVPVGFNKAYEKYQKLFYSLESMGKLELLHDKAFNAVHQDNNPLQTDDDITKFATKNNIDAKQLLAVYHSFSIATKAKQATKVADDYQIDGVPTVLIGGKYVTSSQMVGGRDEVLKVMDYLVNLAKTNANKPK